MSAPKDRMHSPAQAEVISATDRLRLIATFLLLERFRLKTIILFM